ncbi:hypothetical protein ACFWY6_20585, partial [Streptomyces sp. NPDC059037]
TQVVEAVPEAVPEVGPAHAPRSGPSAHRGAADAPEPTRVVEAVPDSEEPTLMLPPVTVDPAPPSRPGDA